MLKEWCKNMTDRRFPIAYKVFLELQNKNKDLNYEKLYDKFVTLVENKSSKEELKEVLWVKSEEEYHTLLENCTYWLIPSANLLYSEFINFDLIDRKYIEIVKYLNPKKIQKILLLSNDVINKISWDHLKHMSPEEIEEISRRPVNQIR